MSKTDLLLLLDRPAESLVLPKGSENVLFSVPREYLNPEHRTVIPAVGNRFGTSSKSVKVNEIVLPSLGEIRDLPKEDNFSLFIPKHRRIAGDLISLFMEMETIEDFLSMAVYARENVNPLLFNYAFTVALSHRRDTRNMEIPSVLFSFPHKYVDARVFPRARELSNIVPELNRVPIEIPMDYTASNLEDEHRLAYFREDIGLNLHHWHWHLVYPNQGPRNIVNKNRRGELFYYMHQQTIARYNFERLCNGMKRTEKFTNFNDPMPEAYFPKLDSHVAGRSYPPRFANMRWKNINREIDQIYVDIDAMERWRDRIYHAINTGNARGEDGKPIPLTENEGIDILGNMVEASILSPDSEFYGDLHNMGHTMAGYVHDPDHRHLESFGVVGDSSTSMRDPFFYRWHAFIDDLFMSFKNTLPRYTVEQLDFKNITISNVQIKTEKLSANILQTYWQKSNFDLSRGLDFQPRGPVFVAFTHLQHRPFTYNITVNNGNKTPAVGTCRIFMAPKYDERGNGWLFRTQKNMFIELDKFRVDLKPGKNSIVRKSSDSSVTIPFERIYRDLDTNRPEGGEALARFNMCGCGWPANLLIPKGHHNFETNVFVMISDYTNDKVDQGNLGKPGDAGSYCGIKDKLYPDRRSMGYPFDRQPRPGVNTLSEFLTPNMKVADVAIQFVNRIVAPGETF